MSTRAHICLIGTVLLAIVVMVVHSFVCQDRGTELNPVNILVTISLTVMIFTSCLYSLSRNNHITWKIVVYVMVALAILLTYRYLLLAPSVIEMLGLDTYKFLRFLYIPLQLAIGIVFIIMLKCKKDEAGDGEEGTSAEENSQ